LTPKEQFDSFMTQADFLTKKVFNRQAYQWKVTLGLWAFIAAFANFSYGKTLFVPWWAFAGVLVLYGFVWLRGVYVHNRYDQLRSWYWRDRAAEILISGKSDDKPEPQAIARGQWRWWIGFFSNWSHLFEFAITAALLLAAFHFSSHSKS
jgi:hypothetical protein